MSDRIEALAEALIEVLFTARLTKRLDESEAIEIIRNAAKAPPPPPPPAPPEPEKMRTVTEANKYRIEKHRKDDAEYRRYPKPTGVACDECGTEVELFGPYETHYHSHWGKIKCPKCGVEGKLAHCFM